MWYVLIKSFQLIHLHTSLSSTRLFFFFFLELLDMALFGITARYFLGKREIIGIWTGESLKKNRTLNLWPRRRLHVLPYYTCAFIALYMYIKRKTQTFYKSLFSRGRARLRDCSSFIVTFFFFTILRLKEKHLASLYAFLTLLSRFIKPNVNAEMKAKPLQSFCSAFSNDFVGKLRCCITEKVDAKQMLMLLPKHILSGVIIPSSYIYWAPLNGDGKEEQRKRYTREWYEMMHNMGSKGKIYVYM